MAQKYVLLGSTGNAYDVHITEQSTCSCPDSQKGNLCKHIIFILAKVLKVPTNSYLLCERAFSLDQLQSMFSYRRFNEADNIIRIRARNDVTAAYENMTKKGDQSQVIEVDAECAICYEALDKKKELMSTCNTCNHILHSDCLSIWLRQSKTCVYCRSVWTASLSGQPTISSSIIMNEGYINLGMLQGVLVERDMSIYHRRKRSKKL